MSTTIELQNNEANFDRNGEMDISINVWRFQLWIKTIRKETENFNNIIKQLALRNTYGTHHIKAEYILLKYTGNILQDSHILGYKTIFNKLKRLKLYKLSSVPK